MVSPSKMAAAGAFLNALLLLLAGGAMASTAGAVIAVAGPGDVATGASAPSAATARPGTRLAQAGAQDYRSTVEEFEREMESIQREIDGSARQSSPARSSDRGGADSRRTGGAASGECIYHDYEGGGCFCNGARADMALCRQ